MARTRMRTARLQLVKILLLCSGHATQAAREKGSDLVGTPRETSLDSSD
jgi:hypothetical protein